MSERFIIPGQWHTVIPIHYGYEECLPGHTFGPAVRENYLLHFIFSGSGCFERNGITYSLSAGDIFVIPPGEVTTYSASAIEPWQYGWIGFTAGEELDFLSAPVIRKSRVLPVFQRIRALCEKDGVDAEIFSLTFELLHILSQESKRSNLTAPDYAIYTKTQLDNTYMQKVNIEKIANTLHIDRRHLTSVFRKTYGVSPQEYLMRLRLERAKEFIQLGHTVSNAATMSGFSDLCNFSRMFKTHYGHNPSSLRRKPEI